MTVSADQTSRVHAPWRRDGKEDRWAEVARPQVHGHDLVRPLHFVVSRPRYAVVLGSKFSIKSATKVDVHALGAPLGQCVLATIQGDPIPPSALLS